MKMILGEEELNAINKSLHRRGERLGLEFSPFKASWYNHALPSKFHFDVPPDTLFYCIVRLVVGLFLYSTLCFIQKYEYFKSESVR